MKNCKEILKDVISYLNEHFNQDSDEYSIFLGGKQQVIRFDEVTAISIWACGAIVCIGDIVFFIEEDDGYWFAREYVDKDFAKDYVKDPRNDYGLRSFVQSCFSAGWLDSCIKALTDLNEYIKENGKPVYYPNGEICHYRLCKED